MKVDLKLLEANIVLVLVFVIPVIVLVALIVLVILVVDPKNLPLKFGPHWQ